MRRSEIERVALARGFTSERPVAALIGAAVCLGIAAVALAMMIAAAFGPRGVVSLKMIIAVVFPALTGALCLWTLMHRVLPLRISTARDTRKLLLLGTIDRTALRDALTAALARFGYDVYRRTSTRSHSLAGASDTLVGCESRQRLRDERRHKLAASCRRRGSRPLVGALGSARRRRD